MITLETNATVSASGILAVHIPVTVAPGVHKVIMVVDEQPQSPIKSIAKIFPKHNVGPWPKKLSLSREDMYGDDGR
jgi:hypothetical protein